MDRLEQAEPVARDGQGRFVPGQSGNPAGKKPGTRNRATVLRERLGEDVADAALQVVVERMRAGNFTAARFLVDRLFPKPKGRAIELALPDDADPAQDHAAVFDAALRAMVTGEITLDEATQVGTLLHTRRQRFAAAPPDAPSRAAADAGANDAPTAARPLPSVPRAADTPAAAPAFILHLQGAAATAPDFRRRRQHAEPAPGARSG